MSARIFDREDWIAARERRARLDRGTRRTIRRGIYLRETRDGLWTAHLFTWRYGRWQAPEVLAAPTGYCAARAAVMAAWRAARLPIFYKQVGAEATLGFRPGLVEPVLEGAA